MLYSGPADSMFMGLTDEAWLDLLIRSVNEPSINTVEMPRFPHGSVQRMIGGSADEHALREAYQFYIYMKNWSSALGRPVHAGSRILDFGCGWGRFARIYWKEIAPDGIFGVDVNPDLIATCKTLGVPGQFSTIKPTGNLPYEDQTFDLIIAYSVFSHLPEKVAHRWIRELARVAKPGCVFALTVEPRRFLQFIRGLPNETSNAWHLGLSRFKSDVPRLLEQYDDGQFCYIPTGGGDGLDSSVYGDAVIPQDYMRRKWGSLFEVRTFIDNESLFWQAFVIMRRL